MRRCLLPLCIATLSFASVGPALAGNVEPMILRGDATRNGALEITDAINVLNFLFAGGTYDGCSQVADSNGDGNVNVADPVYLLSFLFTGGATPPALSAFEERVCGTPTEKTIERGAMIYSAADPLGNLFSCATCHDVTPPVEDAPLVRPGHSLHDALSRPHYKNGRVETFLGAANVCRFDWMITNVWTEDDPDFLDVVSFLKSMATPGPAEPIEIHIVPPRVKGPATGDAMRGCETFHTRCVICHSEGASGSDLAPTLVAFPLEPDYIRQRARLSGNPDGVYGDLIGGVMPFWGEDRLSDDQLEDIVTYLTTRPLPECDDDPPAPEGNVVRAGQLTTRFHDVSGIVEELDSGHIRLREFNFDAIGIVVRVWLYQSGNIRNGMAIGPELTRATPYVNETVVVEIPAEIEPGSFDSVSIWCVAARVSFGDGTILPVR